jgi:hypothetical protein
MNLSLSEATEVVKAKTTGLKLLIPYHIHTKTIFIKKACKFTETIRLFVSFLPVFSSLRIRSCFTSFNISIFVSLAFKIHSCTDLKLVRKQHWNFNEFHF